jgi:hypothetical protein
MVIKVVLIKKDASQNMAELGIKDITLVKVSTTAIFYHRKFRPHLYTGEGKSL